MFDTFGQPINYHDQGSGFPPWENDLPPMEHDDLMEDLGPKERIQKLFEMEGVPEEDRPIEIRASEAEKLYANLLLKTDFERSFIEEMLEFEPDEESEMRIDELRRKRLEMKRLTKVPQTQTIVL